MDWKAWDFNGASALSAQGRWFRNSKATTGEHYEVKFMFILQPIFVTMN